MPIEHAEKIAGSQVGWAILFIVLFFVVISYLVKTSDNREKKLMEFHEQSKADSRERENRLMLHLEKTTEELSAISYEMSRMNERMTKIEKGE